ncbi:MAG: hypothetical protein GDA43_15555 [Hormoscilla sp. SP5CHS1]|nr:hypothetical protein [Hormoscilla sp. SP12CHS1]MBC6454434.1 hypothetical protein [Hormoscilla sp. SP5CHS1]
MLRPCETEMHPAATLLANPPASVQIAIPGICCLEALSVLEQDKKSRKSFEQQLNVQINQAQRNLISPHGLYCSTYDRIARRMRR